VACRFHSADLIIAKLDRLARNVAFVCLALEGAMAQCAGEAPNSPGSWSATEVALGELRSTDRRSKPGLAPGLQAREHH
jgi:hypothetical protein